jgi:predicted ribosome quality control (RQC) complex YloA/Tae2 family protein
MRPKDGIEPETNADQGIYRGQQIARRYVSPDGLIVLAGRTARDNDTLTFKLGSAKDFWLHISGDSGSHVIVRNPEGLARLPRDTAKFAASVAARHSKAKDGGRVAVHLARVSDVKKPRGLPAGKVTVNRGTIVHAAPLAE